MKQIFDNLETSNNPKNNGFANLMSLLGILNDIRKVWNNLPTVKKLPQTGYRLVSLRHNDEGYSLTLFANNSAIESKFNNLMPSLLKDLANFSISQVKIKIRSNAIK